MKSLGRYEAPQEVPGEVTSASLVQAEESFDELAETVANKDTIERYAHLGAMGFFGGVGIVINGFALGALVNPDLALTVIPGFLVMVLFAILSILLVVNCNPIDAQREVSRARLRYERHARKASLAINTE